MKSHCACISFLFILSFFIAEAQDTKPGVHEIHIPLDVKIEPSSVIAISDDGTTLAIANSYKSIKIYDLNTGNEVASLPGHSMNVSALGVSPNGELLGSAALDFSFKLRSIKNVKRSSGKMPTQGDYITAIRFSPDGKYFAIMGLFNEIKVWEIGKTQPVQSIPALTQFSKVIAFSPDSKILVAGVFRAIKAWDLNTGRELYSIPLETMSSTGLDFTPSGKYLVSRNGSSSLVAYDAQSGQELIAFKNEVNRSGSKLFYLDGEFVSGYDDGKLFWVPMWDINGNTEFLASRPNLAALLTPKSQFETSVEYLSRAREGIRQFADQFIAYEIDYRIMTEAKRKASIRLEELQISSLQFGTYNIEKGVFPVTIMGVSSDVAIEREEARSLYENRNMIRIEAMSQLNERLDNREYFNFNIYHPLNGKKYPVGKQEVGLDHKSTVASLPASLTVSNPIFTDADGDNVLSAKESALIQFTIKNNGPGEAHFVALTGNATAPVEGLSAALGNIAAGAERVVSLSIKGGDGLNDGKAEIIIEIKELNGFNADPIKFIITTKTYSKPLLNISEVAVLDIQGRSMITPGTIVDITIRTSNTGEGIAENVKARIVPGEGIFLAGVENPAFTILDIGTIEPGAYKDATFQAFCNRDANSFPVKVSLIESTGQYSTIEKDLGLTLDKPQRTIQELEVSAREMNKSNSRPIALTADIAQNIPQSLAENTDAVAVIIGNKNYQGATPHVAYALNDAQLMRRYVEQSLGFRPGNILYYEDATLTNLKVLFGDQTNTNGKLKDLVKIDRSDVFVFYSGHGAPDPNSRMGYLMPVDADVNRLPLTGFSLDLLYTNLGKLGARSVVVVIDACFSGESGGGEMLIANASPIGIRINNPAARLGENAAIITASDAQQIASWYPEARHGLLTYYFLKGLQGAADKNQDGNITLQEMEQWLTDTSEGLPYMARRLYSREQLPQVWGNQSKVLR
jgi:hypothetical protein